MANNDNDLTIYIASHKDVVIPDMPGGYETIEVGAALHNNNFGKIRDDVGENISKKNKTFCELTAYYWIWKNSDVEYVGLVHYRRFLSKKRVNDLPKYYLNKEQAIGILEDYDVILPEPLNWKNCNVASGYYDHGCGYLKDLNLIEKILKERYPDYISEWKSTINGHSASYCNVLVTRKEYFDKYCEWLFDILFEAEREIDISGYTDSEKRVFGYLSEILLNVWIRYHGLSTYYMPLVKYKQELGRTQRLLKLIEKFPGTGSIVRKGLTFIFNRTQKS